MVVDQYGADRTGEGGIAIVLSSELYLVFVATMASLYIHAPVQMQAVGEVQELAHLPGYGSVVVVPLIVGELISAVVYVIIEDDAVVPVLFVNPRGVVDVEHRVAALTAVIAISVMHDNG